MCGTEGCKPPSSAKNYELHADHEFKPSAVTVGSIPVCKVCCGTFDQGNHTPTSPESYAPHYFEQDDKVVGRICKKCNGLESNANHLKNESLGSMDFSIKPKGPGVTTLTLTLDGDPSPVDALLISELPAMVNMFRQKARDYQTDSFFCADALGAKGQFADLWRKMSKLKGALWDGRTMMFEDTEEILFDFFGHIMLTVGFLRKSNRG